jgi:hypothetical protein
MGFLDKAKKLAEQAKDLAQDALAEAKSRADSASGGGGSAPANEHDPKFGTPYVPGMLGREGWRERGLVDPAAVLPIDDRDRAGVPRSTKSEVLEEPFGMGRRWSADGRSLGLFYQLYPEHQGWSSPTGSTPFADVTGASTTTLGDGRTLVFIAEGDRRVVLELAGIADHERAELARTVGRQLAGQR